ncbi:MAG TPA: hypothetical protein VIL31_14865 [Cyclobacteriaceae bacterium]
MTKSATALLLVLFAIIAFPVAVAIGSTFFGLAIGLLGTIMGVIGSVFGAMFAVVGGILGSSWIPVLILAVIIAAVLSRGR